MFMFAMAQVPAIVFLAVELERARSFFFAAQLHLLLQHDART